MISTGVRLPQSSNKVCSQCTVVGSCFIVMKVLSALSDLTVMS